MTTLFLAPSENAARAIERQSAGRPDRERTVAIHPSLAAIASVPRDVGACYIVPGALDQLDPARASEIRQLLRQRLGWGRLVDLGEVARLH